MKKGIWVILAVVVAVLGMVLFLWLRPPKDAPAKMESVTIGYAPFETLALLWTAEDRHVFARNGLRITSRKYDTGVGALDGVVRGETDIAVGTAEFPLVGSAFRKERIRTFGSIDKIEFIHLVGRKDRGIEKVSDLKGKKVGTTVRTVAHFYLGRFLTLNGMTMKDITLVDLKTPAKWVDAIVTGEIDAIATTQPSVNNIIDRLGANAVVWPAQSYQPMYALIISTDKWIMQHPELSSRFLSSLAQAEEYVNRHRTEAQDIVRKRLNLDPEYMKTVWSQNQYSLSLDQALITIMEDEARWMISNNLTTEKTVPNFLNHIHLDGLKTVKPEAVNIIH
jgi:NitT/TauT family transport system substrate-binding protein